MPFHMIQQFSLNIFKGLLLEISACFIQPIYTDLYSHSCCFLISDTKAPDQVEELLTVLRSTATAYPFIRLMVDAFY
jgi:hypothetical protein